MVVYACKHDQFKDPLLSKAVQWSCSWLPQFLVTVLLVLKQNSLPFDVNAKLGSYSSNSVAQIGPMHSTLRPGTDVPPTRRWVGDSVFAARGKQVDPKLDVVRMIGDEYAYAVQTRVPTHFTECFQAPHVVACVGPGTFDEKLSIEFSQPGPTVRNRMPVAVC
ncbi:uncharacterized protein EI90DRAFT_3019368 [Cantharellus anzutake]|uniref:uncharacterized protein n=1 Tax=Cantharellus anzutake TaxID=1750568 RepID=UPI0019066A91|nr:uncharacterized protein EI90DRAFT_3019368 [Cantharellus anzutake]KAF8324909.1 hypothetical protein EI90DRAFT_3019368 [Cantharellus anzutake]